MPPLKSESNVTWGQLILYGSSLVGVVVFLIGATIAYALQEGAQNSLDREVVDDIKEIKALLVMSSGIQNRNTVDIAVLQNEVDALKKSGK